ncbi:histidine phosphatase family protein [Streptomyces sannanensis]|uniref:Histidine phosphatase family protein n=1 Tax=Streptomyces sannanensis TaxID=285536 RepID=A0ABP6SLC2_9ACTN
MKRHPARRLIVLRHAKSAWPDDIADHERPLAPRGRRDAPAVGRWLEKHGLLPDLVVCSTARRTRETWEGASGELGGAPVVSYDERVYGATVSELLDVVRETPDEYRTLLLIGHNPGAQDFVLELAGDADEGSLADVRAKFPTSALAVLSVDVLWQDLAPHGARLTRFAAPRGT